MIYKEMLKTKQPFLFAVSRYSEDDKQAKEFEDYWQLAELIDVDKMKFKVLFGEEISNIKQVKELDLVTAATEFMLKESNPDAISPGCFSKGLFGNEDVKITYNELTNALNRLVPLHSVKSYHFGSKYIAKAEIIKNKAASLLTAIKSAVKD